MELTNKEIEAPKLRIFRSRASKEQERYGISHLFSFQTEVNGDLFSSPIFEYPFDEPRQMLDDFVSFIARYKEQAPE